MRNRTSESVCKSVIFRVRKSHFESVCKSVHLPRAQSHFRISLNQFCNLFESVRACRCKRSNPRRCGHTLVEEIRRRRGGCAAFPFTPESLYIRPVLIACSDANFGSRIKPLCIARVVRCHSEKNISSAISLPVAFRESVSEIVAVLPCHTYILSLWTS